MPVSVTAGVAHSGILLDSIHVVTCPGCRAPTTPLSLDGQYGRASTIDLCHACNGVWFDGHEDLHLAPGGVIALFESMGQAAPGGAHGDGRSQGLSALPAPACSAPTTRCATRATSSSAARRATGGS